MPIPKKIGSVPKGPPKVPRTTPRFSPRGGLGGTLVTFGLFALAEQYFGPQNYDGNPRVDTLVMQHPDEVPLGSQGKIGFDISDVSGKKNVTKRPSKFRTKTVTDAWDNAKPGSKEGTKQCIDCGKDVIGDPHEKEKRNGPDG